MKIDEAHSKLDNLVGKPLGSWMSEEDLRGIGNDKGRTGKLLEIALGLKNTSETLDFEDGELKTNKCDEKGKPKETIYITQISSLIDELIKMQPFEESKLYKKIKNVLYVPICKNGKPEEWFFLNYSHIQLDNPEFKEIKEQIRADFNNICSQLSELKSKNDSIHTISGSYIQIRTKDTKPYHPIFSKECRRVVSDKNFAFYFKKQFIIAVMNV